MSGHPGGDDKIKELIGQEIDEAFEEAEHSASAIRIIYDLPKVGILEGKQIATETGGLEGMDGIKVTCKWTPDYSRGAVKQLFSSGIPFDEYMKFINEPKHLVNP